MENTILVPLDFTEQSMIALDQACRIALTSHSSLTILNVIKTSSGFWHVISDQEKKDYQKKTEIKLKEIALEIGEKSKIEVGIIIRNGAVNEEIIRVANYLKPILIVMGTSPGVHISRKIIGSKTLHTIKSAKFPVISVKGKLHSSVCENILLPIDATKHTTLKIQLAVDIARMFNSKITLLTAIEQSKKERINLVKEKLKSVKHTIEAEGIKCVSDFIMTENDRSSMAISILGYAHKVNADLIVIMTQQEAGVSDFFLGSLAKNIIFTSDIPVLSATPHGIKSI